MILSDIAARNKALWELARRHPDEFDKIYRQFAGKIPELKGQLPMWARVELPGLMEVLTGDVDEEEGVDKEG